MNPNNSIASYIIDSKNQLAKVGITDTPKLDAEILLAHAIQKNRTYLYTWPEKELSNSQIKLFKTLIKKRLSGKPIAYIVGTREFWGLDFIVNQHTLIPRPDTEIIVIETIHLTKKRQGHVKVLDLGTGSGAIICSLKHELPQIDAYAIDYSHQALEIAKQNAKNLNLSINFIQSDWFKNLGSQKFNLIISNPPYIEEQDPHLNKNGLSFEPITALTSGTDGLKDIKTICKQASKFLHKNGCILIEHGYNQAKDIKEILTKNNFHKIKTIKDYGNNDRVTIGEKT